MFSPWLRFMINFQMEINPFALITYISLKHWTFKTVAVGFLAFLVKGEGGK